MVLTAIDRHALVVVDPQRAFDDPVWGPRNNPRCDQNVALLMRTWQENGAAVVLVTHDSTDPASPLHPSHPGHAVKEFVTVQAQLHVRKTVNSAFHGSPDLHSWLLESKLAGIVICGYTTNHCCETTARVGANLGHEVLFAMDATHTFDRYDVTGQRISADDIARVTGANLQDEFAQVVNTAELC